MNQINSPQSLSDIIGQKRIKENLSIQIAAVMKRGGVLDHLLFCGPYGSGRSTLAKVVANEMGVSIKVIDGKSLRSTHDLAAIFTNLNSGDILLIEQIESLRKTSIEILYPAMENSSLDIVVGKGLSARSIRLKLPYFTIIGTTSKLFQVDDRLKKNMFVYNLEPFEVDEIRRMILIFAKQNEITIDEEAPYVLAMYSKQLPSEAFKLLLNVHKYAIARANGIVTLEVSKDALAILINHRNDT